MYDSYRHVSESRIPCTLAADSRKGKLWREFGQAATPLTLQLDRRNQYCRLPTGTRHPGSGLEPHMGLPSTGDGFDYPRVIRFDPRRERSLLPTSQPGEYPVLTP
jgi:hypothetical protein